MKYFLVILAMMALSLTTTAQQALRGGAAGTSPQINDDRSVTFRIQAPQAREVLLTGDWMPIEGWTPGSVKMERDESGVWSYTTNPLASDLYGYSFIVDGIRMNDPGNVYLIRDVATLTNVFIIGGGQGDLFKVNDVAHGSVTRRWYESPSLEKSRRMTVYTPPGYENSSEQYPVLYLLHGMGGDEEAWIALGRTSQILDNLIATGKAKPMIVVMTNGNAAQQAAPGESDLGMVAPTMQLPNTMDGTFEDSFKDVINFIEKNYRVLANKESRAIAGLSMGGFHALHISRYYPQTFNYIGLFSAAIMPNEKVKSKVYDDFETSLLQQMKNEYKLYWIAIGKNDFLFKANVDYRAKLDAMGFKYTYVETGGGHTWSNWRYYLSEFVPLLFKDTHLPDSQTL